MTEEQIIQDFAREMYKKVELRHNRYQPFAWKDMDLKRLIKLLKGEITELEEGFDELNDEQTASEAIDVANYACFIWQMIKDKKNND
jgi:NTP pyrophosphatase (non-canonical NTP hydrolase)